MESLAQLGVQLLLFTLGLEFSMSKLRAVRSVALLGGYLVPFVLIPAERAVAAILCCSPTDLVNAGESISASFPTEAHSCKTPRERASNAWHKM